MNRPLTFAESVCAIDTPKLPRLVDGWLLDGEVAQHSQATRDLRRIIMAKLAWFLADRELPTCDADALRTFLAYVANGHRDSRGRWGDPRNRKPAKPGTVATYSRHLRAFYAWAIREGVIDSSPMDRIPSIVDRPDDVHPPTGDVVRALLDAARKSKLPERNVALLYLLTDSACRVSEVCSLRMNDLDLSARQIIVEGKGGKRRAAPVGPTTTRSLYTYLRDANRKEDDFVFRSERGGPLDRNAVLHLFKRLQRAAGIVGVRCSPHSLRHFAATEFLRGGGNPLALQRLLGHTSLAMTRRYTQVVDADVARQHRLASPVERLNGKGVR